MKTNVRRITTLALVLVLICSLATGAFALSRTVGETIGENSVTGTATISQYTVSGMTDVEGTNSIGDKRSVNLVYTYYLYNYTDENDYRSQYLYDETYTESTAYVSKGFSVGQIYSMRDCTATFRATIVTSTTTAYFAPDAMNLVYYNGRS